MPHATSPNPGFQALILCGPGENLLPFNSNPKDFPKALIPIANRPMVWYPLDWCHAMGVSDIYLITPPECSAALDAALSQNPYLTSLPSPKPTLISPADLTLTTGTAELLRLKEVQQVITSDFVVLPCDLVCEMPGTSLLDVWMTMQGSVQGGQPASQKPGGLGVWYETKDASEGGVGVKKEETDFLATTKCLPPSAAPCPSESLLPQVRQVRIAMPTGTLKDEFEDNKALRLRSQLLRNHGNVKLHMTHRDSHIYLFPHWVKEYARQNESFDSLGEDLLGWWAKASWQSGLSSKLHFEEAMRPAKRRKSDPTIIADDLGVEYNLADLSSTVMSDLSIRDYGEGDLPSREFASRVETQAPNKPTSPHVPSILTYMHPAHYVPNPSTESNPKQKQQKQTTIKQHQSAPEPTTQTPSSLIRRIDTVPLLLSTSLYLARLPAMLEALPGGAAAQRGRHPFAHAAQVHASTTLPGQASIHTATTLLDANVALQPRITIRDSVIGANCSIASGARIHGCLLMEGVIVEEKAVLSGCVLGRRCRVGRETDLKDCFVQEGYVISEGTKAKGDVMAGFSRGEDGLLDEEEDGAEGLDLSGA